MTRKLLTLALFSIVFVLAGASFAQTTLTQTTLAADQTVGPSGIASGLDPTKIYATTVNLTSATGVTQAFVNTQPVTYIYVDNEVEGILTLVTGQTTIFNVLRAQMGTKAQAHKANAVVWIQVLTPQFGGGSGSGGFQQTDPPMQGNCVAANTLFTPWINVLTGEQWVCAAYTTPAGNSITSWIPASAFLFPSQNIPLDLFTSASYTNATTTFSNVPNLSFFAQANRTYKVQCDITWQGSASTTGPKYQWTGPSSPTAVLASAFSMVTATTVTQATVTAFSSAMANTGTVTTATNFTDRVTLWVQNGANAGTIQLQAAANGAGTLTIAQPSGCHVQ